MTDEQFEREKLYQASMEMFRAMLGQGLVTEEDAKTMRDGGSGYMGYRIGIAEDGTWMFAVAGD